MSVYKVTSEIHTENDNSSVKSKDGHTISKFFFKYPGHVPPWKVTRSDAIEFDDDGDLIVNRDTEGTLLIEHSVSTELQLVGLQVWRGAFLLGDYILHNPKLFEEKTVLELGSGVGLTSIVAGMFAKEVIATDVAYGGILKLLEENGIRNKMYIQSKFSVMELNFLEPNWSERLQDKMANVSVVLAADVIYDDRITDGFVSTLRKLLDSDTSKTVYIALEKRYVFTVADLDSVAPMYEEFLRCVERQKASWKIEQVKINFPQYFKYERVKHLVLLKIENRDPVNTHI